MALYKEKIENNGITTRYHKIKKVSLAMRSPYVDEEKNETINDTHLLTISVKSYVTEDYRRNFEENPAYSRDYHIRVTLNEISSTPIISLAYYKLKYLDEFYGSRDC